MFFLLLLSEMLYKLDGQLGSDDLVVLWRRATGTHTEGNMVRLVCPWGCVEPVSFSVEWSE